MSAGNAGNGTDPLTLERTALALRPPLKPALTVQYPHKVSQLPLIHDGRVFLRTPEATTASDESTGRLLWKSKTLDFPRVVWRSHLVAERHVVSGDGVFDTVGLEIVDAPSGRLDRFVAKKETTPVVVSQDRLICAAIDDDYRTYLGAMDFETGDFLWRWRSAEVEPQPLLLTAGAGGVYVGLDDGSLLALDAEKGTELWHHAMSDLEWEVLRVRPGALKAAPSVAGEFLICDVHLTHVVALRASTGDRAWVWRSRDPIREGFLCDEKYFVLTDGRLIALEAKSGEVLTAMDLRRTLPEALRTVEPTSPLFVSRTHAFTGSRDGRVLAFERDTGKYVWSHRPDDGGPTAHDGSRFLVSAGRLYYSDMAYRLYCLQEDRGGTEVLDKRVEAPSITEETA